MLQIKFDYIFNHLIFIYVTIWSYEQIFVLLHILAAMHVVLKLTYEK